MATARVPSARGSRVLVMINNGGTALTPGLILRATRDRAHVLVKKGGEYVTKTYRLSDWHSDYVCRPSDITASDHRTARAFAQLQQELKELNGRLPSLTGDESISEASQLEGRRVNMMLHNGVCVIGACISSVFWFGGERRLAYRNPRYDADSIVPLHSIGHMHVFGTKEDPDCMPFDAAWYVHTCGV